MSAYNTKLPNLGGANAMNTIDHIVEVNSPLIRGNTLNESLEHSIDETRPLLGIHNIMTATAQLPIRIKASKMDHPQLDPSLDTPPQVEVNSSYHFCFQKGSNILRQPFIPSQRRRRRSLSDIMHLDERELSFSDDVGQASSETYHVTRLSFTLLRYLGFGYRWILRLSALGLYALFLMPGIVQAGCYYIFSKTIKHSIVYGEGPRNRLDLYIPENLDNPKPVVAFVTGGAWIIGYKAWGVLLGQQLAERDVIVACIDYRNFPQGTISDMVKDASKGISFICNNIGEYGGDPNRIYLAGQSAGAHIAACVLVEQAKREMECDTELTWRLSHLKAYIAISGGYNLFKLVNHFHSRGLYRSIFVSVMEGEKSLVQFSPELVVQSPSFSYATSLLPPFYLFHGMEDYSIPCDASTSFAESLSSVGASVKVKLYPGKTHTDLFLQDPMRGGFDSLFSDILTIVHMGDPDAEARDAIASPRRRMVPEILLRLARMVSPF